MDFFITVGSSCLLIFPLICPNVQGKLAEFHAAFLFLWHCIFKGRLIQPVSLWEAVCAEYNSWLRAGPLRLNNHLEFCLGWKPRKIGIIGFFRLACYQ